VVNARELHEFLGVGKDFSTWVKDRIEKYGFEEDSDYALFDSPNLGNQTGRGGDRKSKDYLLTLDCAKEISMAENSERGRQVRKYFIRGPWRAWAPRDDGARGVSAVDVTLLDSTSLTLAAQAAKL